MKLKRFTALSLIVLVCIVVAALFLSLLRVYSEVKKGMEKNNSVSEHLNHGSAHFKRGEYELAAEDFRKALQLSPSDLTAQENLDSAIRMGDPVAWLTKHPSDDGVRENLIGSLLEKGEWSQARAQAALFSDTNNTTRCLQYIAQEERVDRTTGTIYTRGGDADPLRSQLTYEISSYVFAHKQLPESVDELTKIHSHWLGEKVAGSLLSLSTARLPGDRIAVDYSFSPKTANVVYTNHFVFSFSAVWPK